MTDSAAYSFDLREVTTALIKQQGLKGGTWLLGIEFNFGALNIGQGPEDVKPAALVQVAKVQLVPVPDGAERTGLMVDAADVNPA